MSTGMADSNPTIGSYKPELAAPRERVLTDDELVRVWKAVEGGGDFATIVRLLMLSACRRDEIGLLRSGELDLDEGVLSLPGSRTKNGVAHVLPITPLMAERDRAGAGARRRRPPVRQARVHEVGP